MFPLQGTSLTRMFTIWIATINKRNFYFFFKNVQLVFKKWFFSFHKWLWFKTFKRRGVEREIINIGSGNSKRSTSGRITLHYPVSIIFLSHRVSYPLLIDKVCGSDGGNITKMNEIGLTVEDSRSSGYRRARFGCDRISWLGINLLGFFLWLFAFPPRVPHLNAHTHGK